MELLRSVPSLSNLSRWCFLFGTVACLFLASGCSNSDHGHVTGTVKIDGQPVEGAQIRFAPPEGRAAWDTTKADGSYELNYTPGVKGAKTGTNTVTISTYQEPVRDDNGRITQPAVPERFPPEYNQQPTHQVEVQPGKNVFDFDVPSTK